MLSITKSLDITKRGYFRHSYCMSYEKKFIVQYLERCEVYVVRNVLMEDFFCLEEHHKGMM
jgi:hypothetical protein